LVAIWQELLQVEKVGVHDDFFDLGGHSLLLIRLIARINKVLDTDIKINLMFQYPVLSQFAANLNSKNSFEDSVMVSLQNSGNKKAIYLVPEVSGTMNSYFELAKSLGENQNVYAFQCPGLDGKTAVLESVDEMATLFISKMQKVDPHGPYRLGGYSFGSKVAYEMALQLRRDGFEVEELVIFDGKVESPGTTKVKDEEEAFQDFLRFLSKDYGKAFDWSDVVLDGKSVEAQIEEIHRKIGALNEMELKGKLKVMFNNYQLFKSYKPKNEKQLDVKITLFKAMHRSLGMNGKKEAKNTAQFDYGWNKYTTKDVVIHSIPSNHWTILSRDHTKRITELLNQQEEMSI
ncbi:MAG: thioesterase domain-containing protein, partial [Bacteroidota bacterium]